MVTWSASDKKAALAAGPVAQRMTQASGNSHPGHQSSSEPAPSACGASCCPFPPSAAASAAAPAAAASGAPAEDAPMRWYPCSLMLKKSKTSSRYWEACLATRSVVQGREGGSVKAGSSRRSRERGVARAGRRAPSRGSHSQQRPGAHQPMPLQARGPGAARPPSWLS